MNDVTMDTISIDTEQALYTILGKFSDDYIDDMIQNAIRYRFRPISTPIPNYVHMMEMDFNNIRGNYHGATPELISAKRDETYARIIENICNAFQLQHSPEIPDESVYSFTFLMMQIFVCEFYDNMIRFYVNYINKNQMTMLGAIPTENRKARDTAKKKLYADPTSILIYENIESVLIALASMDIPLEQYIAYVTDEKTAQFICTYLDDCGDYFRNYIAIYINQPMLERTDVISSVKSKFVANAINQQNMLRAISGEKPMWEGKEEQ